jgi:hypothetical protein
MLGPLENSVEWPSFAELCLLLEGCRRLEESEPVPKSRALVSLLAHIDDERFQQDVWMTHRAFEHAMRCIVGNPVFMNRSNNQQALVDEQLYLSLYQLGCSGNGASVEKVARWLGALEGMAIHHTNRAIATLFAPLAANTSTGTGTALSDAKSSSALRRIVAYKDSISPVKWVHLQLSSALIAPRPLPRHVQSLCASR